jgi:hypothetical protein
VGWGGWDGTWLDSEGATVGGDTLRVLSHSMQHLTATPMSYCNLCFVKASSSCYFTTTKQNVVPLGKRIGQGKQQ